MITPKSGLDFPPTWTDERGAILVLIPITVSFAYYALPDRLQTQTLLQLAPQIIAYLAFALWAKSNDRILTRLGFTRDLLKPGLKLGILIGLVLGSFNTLVILQIIPNLGYDITFLKHTPHAKLPVSVMIPWFIFGIALFVELNFRGFLLGRLIRLETAYFETPLARSLSPLSLLCSTLVFAFDPFMVNTFQQLHWIAVWDGMIWGLIVIRTGNLCATIVAHAVEVIVMYSTVRYMLMA